MRRVFADAVYWVALAHRKDHWHKRAVAVSAALESVVLVTTDEVLDEFVTHFSAFGSEARQQVSRTVLALLSDPGAVIIPQSRESFLAGLALYEARLDKTYSLTDCISMATMRREGMTEVLTHDMHFTQEGFTVLL